MPDYQIRCDVCKQYFSKGEAHKCHIPKLMKNNPKGNNKYTPKEELTPTKVLTWEETYMRLSDMEKKEEIQRLGNEIWKESSRLMEMKRKFTRANKIYFGWKFGEV